MRMNWSGCAALGAAALALAAAGPAAALTVTDLAGRTVEVPDEVDSVILGEGRQFYVVAALEGDRPFDRIIGWRDDLLTTDRQIFEQFAETFPEIEDVPIYGNVGAGDFSVEQAIVAEPDVVVLNLQWLDATLETGLLDQLEAAGIASVFIDFREDPIANTVPSIALLGQVLGREGRAADLITFYETEMARVTGRLAGYDGPRPTIFLERAAGLSEECCNSFGPGNMGEFVTFAGGINVAEPLIPGTFGTVNLEQVFAFDPDHYIATGSNWSLYNPANSAVSLGSGSDPAQAEAQLQGLMDRPGFGQLSAVAEGRVHAVWHQFYNSPYHFALVQQLAKWLHPDLFADLDPDDTFRRFHAEFLPIEYRGGYWVSLPAVTQ